MDSNNIIECGGFYFIHNFDSGNLGHVERVPTELIAPSPNAKTNAPEIPDYEFNMWTRPDCAGTEFENGNRTWFYFGVQASEPATLVRLNLINLNKQGKMYNQGMAPVTRTLPGKPQWERIRDRPIHSTDDNTFTLSFKYRTPENLKATTFFAFTYPFSFAELQIALNSIDLKMLPLPAPQTLDDIYYYRECLIYSLEGRRVDLLTITSHHGITTEREDRLKHLFPDNQERPFKFENKKDKVIRVTSSGCFPLVTTGDVPSGDQRLRCVLTIPAGPHPLVTTGDQREVNISRVHPGETPSSFVFNGFLNLLLTRSDPIAIQLRRLYVFKMIPFLNPDGVARGHYRTDTRGVNLNRVYLNPSLVHHPTVYASRALIRYYHYGCEKEDICEDSPSFTSRSMQNICESVEIMDPKKKKASTSTSSPYKGEVLKREKSNKPLTTSKSSTTIKKASIDSKKDSAKMLTGEAASLAEQVYDMKLQEQPSQTSASSSKLSVTNLDESTSLLNDNNLRSCLGSSVHLSTSDELNIQGGNPLRPLRDTLKNSISLLMESSSSNAGDSSLSKDSRTTNVKIGWCQECRLAVDKLESTMPGIASIVPGYSAMLNDTENAAKGEQVYFCTNCFKRFVVSEEMREQCAADTCSVSVSCGDNGDVPTAPAHAEYRDGSTGDTPLVHSPSPEKSKSPSPTKIPRKKPPQPPTVAPPRPVYKEPESGLYLYIDLHGHASKKGIFMYGNHFEDADSCVECMLLPRIMSLNNRHFHFSSCNFTERNMYLKDRRDGMSREGSGRVAVLKATGLVRSYTLECNYNTGRLVNVLPPPVKDATPAPAANSPPQPPKYTPHIFEEVRNYRYRAKNLEFFGEIDPWKVGRSLGASILDLTGQHPNSRVPCSEHRTLAALREWLRAHTRTARPQLTMSRLRPKATSPNRVPLYARSKAKVVDERKENTYVGAKTDTERKRSPPLLAQRSGHDIINVNMKFAKKNEPVKSTSRTKYLSENEPKPKTLSTKRRNILAIRKPNTTSKTQVGGVVKAKVSRRAADDGETARASVTSKISKRSFSRTLRSSDKRNRIRAMASSSSEDVNWEEVAGGTLAAGVSSVSGKRRPFPNPAPSHLKKIRLKTGL